VAIGGGVIMTKEIIDSSREDSATEAPQFTRADFLKSDASPEPYAGTPASRADRRLQASGRQPHPALATANS
jgi:hypothetical protein